MCCIITVNTISMAKKKENHSFKFDQKLNYRVDDFRTDEFIRRSECRRWVGSVEFIAVRASCTS